MADREGFEPSETLLPHTLSKRAHSTTLPSVRLKIAHWVEAGGSYRADTGVAIPKCDFFTISVSRS